MLSSARHWFAARLRSDPGAFSLAIPMAALALTASVEMGDDFDPKMAPPVVVVLGLLAGAYAGALGAVLLASILLLGGRLLGGKGRFVDMRAAVGWSMAPLMVAAVIRIISLPLLGSAGLGIVPWLEPEGVTARVLDITLVIIEIGCALLSTVLTYTFVSVAHGFSAWRALLGHIVGVIIVAVPACIFLAVLIPWLLELLKAD